MVAEKRRASGNRMDRGWKTEFTNMVDSIDMSYKKS